MFAGYDIAQLLAAARGCLVPDWRGSVHPMGERDIDGEYMTTKEDRGPLYPIVTLFTHAWKHIKTPHVDLDIPGHHFDITISVSDRVGSLLVFRGGWEPSQGERQLLGQISVSGHWSTTRTADMSPVESRLRQFATDPSAVAGEIGKRFGKCCFCRKPLAHDGTLAVETGYNEECSWVYGLTWWHKRAYRPGESMSGLQMRAIRKEMEMEPVTFGNAVLGSRPGQSSTKTVYRWVRRLEEQASLDASTANKVWNYYQNWVEDRGEDVEEAEEAVVIHTRKKAPPLGPMR